MSVKDPPKRPRQRRSEELTEREKRFVDEYLIDLNAKEAVLRAGYQSAYPRQQGYEMLQKPKIVEAITRAQAKRARRTRIDQTVVLVEAFRQYKLAADSAGRGKESRPAERAQALKALEMVGRHVDVMAFRNQIGVGNLDGSNFDFSGLNDAELADLERLLAKAATSEQGSGGDSEA